MWDSSSCQVETPSWTYLETRLRAVLWRISFLLLCHGGFPKIPKLKIPDIPGLSLELSSVSLAVFPYSLISPRLSTAATS